MWYVYILQCSDNSYYIGLTDDLERRIKEHQAGQGGSYTSKKIPVDLKYNELYRTRKEAERRERQIKGWSRAKKEALIRENIEILQQLSRSKL
jgi:predicted GIY-YIG superfamily endonuclease